MFLKTATRTRNIHNYEGPAQYRDSGTTLYCVISLYGYSGALNVLFNKLENRECNLLQCCFGLSVLKPILVYKTHEW